MKKLSKSELLEKSKVKRIQLAAYHRDYIRNKLNGDYYLTRYNMLAEQINNNKIEEKIDGLTKSHEYAVAEAKLMKMQSIMSYANASTIEATLKKDFERTDEDIKNIEKYFLEKSIVRENYDEIGTGDKGAKFVDTSED